MNLNSAVMECFNVGNKDTFVQSYLIDYEMISAKKKVGILFFLLIHGKETFLCRYHKTVVVSCDTKQKLSILHFLNDVPVPFEDTVKVYPSNFDSSKLNRVLKLERDVAERQDKRVINYADFYSEYVDDNFKITLNTKRRFLNRQPNANKDALSHFIKTQIDFSCKESLKSYLSTMYLKSIQVRNNKSFHVPKSAACSFLKYGHQTLVKHLLEELSEFAVATNCPEEEIELRKIAYVPKFNYAAVFRNNMQSQTLSNIDAPTLLVSNGRNTIMVSSNDKIVSCFNNDKKLARALEKTSIRTFHTQRPSIRRKFHKMSHINVKLNYCIPKCRLSNLKRALQTTRDKFFFKQKFITKGGVTYLNKKKLLRQCVPDKNIYVHDFRSFYPTTVLRQCVDSGMKRVFNRLIMHRKTFEKMKVIANTMFGISKRYYPQMFYRTLNETVYVMYKVFKRNKKNVFAMCKDSFFSTSKTLSLPFPDYQLKVDHTLNNFVMKNINTYAGKDAITSNLVIKGLHYAPFPAARKIVLGMFKHLTDQKSPKTIDIPLLLKDHIQLEESDFYVEVNKKKLKTSDYFYYGVDEMTDYLYCKDISERELYHVPAAEATEKVRPRNMCGKIDIQEYVDKILMTIIRFARAIGYQNIINESEIYETDLFLRRYIQHQIFQRVRDSGLPGFQLHECQLLG